MIMCALNIGDIFVLCFYKENHESMAMWKTYLPEAQGVLVSFHKEKINNLIKQNAFLSFGEVRYNDIFRTNWGVAFKMNYRFDF